MASQVSENNLERNFLAEKTSFNSTIDLRSEMAQEIISQKPGFFEKWAILIFIGLVFLIVSLSWLVKSPDVILAGATLSAINAPKEIVTHQSGNVVRLFAKNDETVLKGQQIAWLESAASHSQVLSLAQLLDSAALWISLNKPDKVGNLFKTSYNGLGEIQTSYQQFITALRQFDDYLVNGFHYKRKQMLLKDQEFLKKMHLTLEAQKELATQDLTLSRESFDATNSLVRDSVLSRQELRDQRSKLVAKEISIPQLQSLLLTNESAQVGKQKEIDELDHTISQQLNIFEEAVQTMLSAIADWKLKYVISAPYSGRIAFTIPLQQNQYLEADKVIGYVEPSGVQYFGQVVLAQKNFGKILIGQRVLLRLDAYPFEEFGSIPGMLSHISRIPSDSGFLAEVELPNGLTTNYRKVLQYKSGLKCQAVITTRDLRLFQRFYYSVSRSLHETH
jgi:multidrug efflux pump subunit AcrA (membrane-fusion protein)